MKRAVFFERDTLLNLANPKAGQQKTPLSLEDFHVNEHALAPLQRLKAACFVIIATTNQPEVSIGGLSRRELERMHEVLRAKLPIDDVFVCPHEQDDDCPCRKPRAGLFHEAAFKYHLLLGQSYVISHRWQDAEAARLIGSTSLLLDSPMLGRGHHDFVVRDLDAAADKILSRLTHRQVA